MKTKHEVLLENGYEELIGYVFPTPPADDEFDNTFVSKEDADPIIANGAKTYYWIDGERILDLDDAWEQFGEQYCDDNNLILTNDEFDVKMGVK